MSHQHISKYTQNDKTTALHSTVSSTGISALFYIQIVE